MFGFTDLTVAFAFILMILSTVLCMMYAIANWNKGDAPKDELKQESAWNVEEEKLIGEFTGEKE